MFLSIEDFEKKPMDPIGDAEASIREGNLRFISVFDIFQHAPGVDWVIAMEHGHDPIRGTSDFRPTERDQRLNDFAYDYAKVYNELILKEIMTRGQASQDERNAK